MHYRIKFLNFINRTIGVNLGVFHGGLYRCRPYGAKELANAFLQRYRPYGTKEHILAEDFLCNTSGVWVSKHFHQWKKHLYFPKIDTYGAVSNRTYLDSMCGFKSGLPGFEIGVLP